MSFPKRVDWSRKQWENAQSNISNLNKSSVLEIESTVKENVNRNNVVHEEFLSASSAMTADFDCSTRDILTAVADSLMRDRESKKEIEFLSARSSLSLFKTVMGKV